MGVQVSEQQAGWGSSLGFFHMLGRLGPRQSLADLCGVCVYSQRPTSILLSQRGTGLGHWCCLHWCECSVHLCCLCGWQFIHGVYLCSVCVCLLGTNSASQMVGHKGIELLCILTKYFCNSYQICLLLHWKLISCRPIQCEPKCFQKHDLTGQSSPYCGNKVHSQILWEIVMWIFSWMSIQSPSFICLHLPFPSFSSLCIIWRLYQELFFPKTFITVLSSLEPKIDPCELTSIST